MEQTVTIVNNSGKIISTGKQLFSIFQEAKAVYAEKKENVRAERAALSRANTFDGTRSVQRAPSVRQGPPSQYAASQYAAGQYAPPGQYAPSQYAPPGQYAPSQYAPSQYASPVQYAQSARGDEAEFRPRTLSRAQTTYYVEEDQYTLQDQPRRASYDTASVASSRRTHRTHRTKASHHGSHHGSQHGSHHGSQHGSHHGSQHGSHRPRSTRAPSEAGSVALTENNLKAHSEAGSVRSSRPPTAMSGYRRPYAETVPMGQSNMDLTVVDRSVYYPADTRTAIVPVARPESQYGASQYDQPECYYAPHSDASMPQSGALVPAPKTKKIDMDLAYGNIPPDLAERTDLDPDQGEATVLVRKVQGLLDEAECVQESAKAMIQHLQEKPEAAAAVALTLSELSAVASKMSPAVLSLLKGGSPAVFALLASPQFLIASGLAVGVTVVMFGGWKIVKKVQQERAAQAAIAYEPLQPLPAIEEPYEMERPELEHVHTYAEGGGYDEALVVDEALSTIESWRRGIEPLGDEESADIELITPEADRATRVDERDFDDNHSHRSSRTHRSSKTSKTSRTHKSSKSHKSHHSSRHDDDDDDRKSTRSSSSRAGSSSSKHKSRSEVDDSRSSRSSRGRSREDVDLPVRPKGQRQQSDLFKNLFKRKNKDASRSQLVVA